MGPRTFRPLAPRLLSSLGDAGHCLGAVALPEPSRHAARRGWGCCAAGPALPRHCRQARLHEAFRGPQQRGFSWHATPERLPQSSDIELYDKFFKEFGVSPSQFGVLMSQATRYRADPGSVVVKGGEPFRKIAMILSGEAVAHKCSPDLPDGELGKAQWKYVGKLGGASEDVPQDARLADLAALPSRGSLLCGENLVDPQASEEPQPAEVIAASQLDWVEWPLETLQNTIDAPRWRSVQACFYYQLYAELASSLGNHRAMKRKLKELDGGGAPRPSTRQLLALSAFVAVPFFGFGFADNFIMIIAGDAIDSTFGATFGLTTLAAAGVGNWLSDVVGLGLGDAIEQGAGKLGLTGGGLTPAQEKLRIAKLTTLMSKIIGITLGCFAGMIPLLFLTPKKREFANEDLAIYDLVFRPHGVSTQQFAQLMERGTKHWGIAGHVLVEGGKKNSKVVLLMRGKATAYLLESNTGKRTGRPLCTYVGRLDTTQPEAAKEDGALPSRGSVIGGTAIAIESKRLENYPNDVIASEQLHWIQWDYEDLKGIMKEEKAIQASFYAMLYSQLIHTVTQDAAKRQLEKYMLLLAAIVSDDRVDAREREFLEGHRQSLRISPEEHARALQSLGWTVEDWQAGWRGRRSRLRLSQRT